MPLERARDSLLHLHELAAESSDSFLESHKQASSDRSGGGGRGGDDDSSSGNEHANAVTPAHERPHVDDPSGRGCERFWQAGEDWDQYVDIRPLEVPPEEKRGRSTKRCFPSLWTFCDPHSTSSDSDDDDGSGDEITVVSKSSSSSNRRSPEQDRGILRMASVNVQICAGVNKCKRSSFHPKTYSATTQSAAPKRVRFARRKTHVRICPQSCMTPAEKDVVWWRLEDFDRFKADILLLVQSEEDEQACKAWLANHRPVLGTPSERSQRWWHKYGDSRRGLEKYASADQMTQTLDSYKVAMWHVLNEQRIQRSLFGRQDPERLARVYREHTAWSRDLALAAAASDADAVATNFDDERRKSREFFLLKQIFTNDGRVHQHQPEFMMPSGLRPVGYLDEHQSNQISSPKI